MAEILFFILLGAFLFLGYYSSKKVNTESSYLLADRKTSLFPLVATLVMTEFNTSTLIAFSGFGYVVGVWGLTLPLVFLIGLGFYTFTVSRKWKKLNGYSVSEVFKERYGDGFGKLVSILLIFAMMGFSATYVKSLTILFTGIVPLLGQFWLSLILVSLVVLIVIRGGLVSIIQTDIYSFLLALIIIPSIFYFSFSQTDRGWIALVEDFPVETAENLPLKFVVSLIIITMFTYISAPWYGQKIFSAKDDKTAFYGVGISSILVFLLYSFPILAVAYMKVNQLKGYPIEQMIPYIIQNYFPEWLKAFGLVFLFLTSATTLAGVWSAMTTMLIGDFARDVKSTDKKSSIQFTLFFAFLSWLFSILFVDSILNKLILANIPIFGISFALLAGFYWKKASRNAAYISTGVGFFWGVACYFNYGDEGQYTWYWSIYGVPLIFISGILFSYLYPNSKSEQEKVDLFLEKLN